MIIEKLKLQIPLFVQKHLKKCVIYHDTHNHIEI